MSWLILSLLALTCFVVYDIAARFLATKSENPQVFAAIYNGSITLFTPILFLFDNTLPHDITPKIIILTLIGLIIWGLFGRFEYFARQHTEASVFTIVCKLAPVINFFLSLIVFKESWSIAKIMGIIIIVIANLLLFVGQSKNSIISVKGLQYSILVSLLLAFGWLFDAFNVKAWGVATFSIFSFVAPTLASSIFPKITISQIKKELSLSPLWQISLLGFFNLIGYGFMLKALSLGPSSSVIPIINSTSPFIVLFGYLILGEKKSLTRKIIACSLTVIAIYLMR